ncbi:hypothetical protein BDZ89DRAFT_999437 [Hymenopellis radicata]|nr:hypothetical protein BDZ89DRAFT_999437 [Hymenopellis radicata]
MRIVVPLLLSLSLAFGVYAHGVVHSVTINKREFAASFPPIGSTEPSTDGVVRVVATRNPVKSVDDIALNCGWNASKVSDMAVGEAGNTMQFKWNAAENPTAYSPWFHDAGPIVSYMTRCTNDNCPTFDTTNAPWFKIDQQGFDTAEGKWISRKIMDGRSVDVPIPANLKAGQYIVRHEIIALHIASELNGAEFYPSCTQLTVTGNGTGVPAEGESVKFPGAYNASDPGILCHAYDPTSQRNYTFPGPDVAAFVRDSETGSSSAATSPASGSFTSPPGAASTSTSTSGTSTHTLGNASSASSSRPKTCSKSGKRSVKKRSVKKRGKRRVQAAH